MVPVAERNRARNRVRDRAGGTGGWKCRRRCGARGASATLAQESWGDGFTRYRNNAVQVDVWRWSVVSGAG